MGRPPHPIGTAGRTRTYQTPTGWRARTTFRDHDGVTREVQRAGKTKAAAERALQAALRDRDHRGGAGALTPDSRVTAAVEAWWGDVSVSDRMPGTLDQYRRVLDVHVLRGVGQLKIRELTVTSTDRFLRAVEAGHGAATAKMCRSVLSGICGWCARRDLLDRNPVRDTAPVTSRPRTPPRALTLAQVHDLLTWMGYDDRAKWRGIPPLVLFMLATGVRVGEAAAVLWNDIDLDGGTVTVAANVVRIKGRGLVRQVDESSKLKCRVLVLPAWAVVMLRRHRETQDPASLGLVFPAPLGGLRDPSNTNADMRDAFAFAGYGWVTSHTFRKTVATLIDEGGLSARAAADQLGHSDPSMTQARYFGRRISTGAAGVLEAIDGAGFVV